MKQTKNISFEQELKRENYFISIVSKNEISLWAFPLLKK